MCDKHDHRGLSVGALLDQHDLVVTARSAHSSDHYALPSKRLIWPLVAGGAGELKRLRLA